LRASPEAAQEQCRAAAHPRFDSRARRLRRAAEQGGAVPKQALMAFQIVL
jgi:hypothetical protein